MFEGFAEDAATAAAEMVTETGKVAAMRLQLSALAQASALRMERARAEHLDRLKSKKPAGAAMRDPRDDFGTAAPDEIFVAGDN